MQCAMTGKHASEMTMPDSPLGGTRIYSRKLIPGSVLEGPFVRCPEAGHMSPLENPEPANQASANSFRVCDRQRGHLRGCFWKKSHIRSFAEMSIVTGPRNFSRTVRPGQV